MGVTLIFDCIRENKILSAPPPHRPRGTMSTMSDRKSVLLVLQ